MWAAAAAIWWIWLTWSSPHLSGWTQYSPQIRWSSGASGEFQLQPAGESGRPGGSPDLPGWTHCSPQSQVSCSCCQLVNLLDLVVLLVCQHGYTVHHRVRWAATATSRSHMSGDGHTMHSPYSGEPQLLPAILSSVRMDTPFATKPGVLSSCHTMDFPWVRSLVIVKRLCFTKGNKACPPCAWLFQYTRC